MLDTRREVAHIWREYSRYQRIIGEEVVWFKFDTEGSEYDSVYEEGGRDYERGIRLPILWVDQVEDPEQYQQDGGRRPQQRIRFAVSANVLKRACISTSEAHGRELDTPQNVRTGPVPQLGRPTVPWLDDRLNDVIYYDKRFYSISNYQIRGRAKHDDVIIGVSGLELIPDDESIWDKFPRGNYWGDLSAGLHHGMGLVLTPVIGENYSVSFEIDSPTPLSGAFAFRVVSVDGTEVFSIPITVTTVSASVSALSVTITTAQLDLLSPWWSVKWELTQTHGGDDTLVHYGVMVPTSGIHDDAPFPEEPSADYQIEMSVVIGEPSIWTVSFGVPLSGEFDARLVEDVPGGAEVDPNPLEVIEDLPNGLIGVYLSDSAAILSTKVYRCILTQTVPIPLGDGATEMVSRVVASTKVLVST